MAKRKTRKKNTHSLFDNEIVLYIYSLFIIAMALIGMLEVGIVGQFLTQCITYLVGNLYGVLYALIIVLAIVLMKDKTLKQIRLKYVFGFLALFIAWLMLCATPGDENLIGMPVFNQFTSHSKAIIAGEMSSGGGIVGAFLFAISSLLFERVGTFIMVALLILLGLLLVVSKSKMQQTHTFFKDKGSRLKDSVNQASSNRKEKKLHKQLEREQKEKESLSFIDYDDVQEDYADLVKDNTKEDYADLINEREKISNPLFLDVNDVKVKEKDVLGSTSETNVVTPTVIREVKAIPKTSKFMSDYTNYRLPSARLLNTVDKKGKSGANTSAASESGKLLVHILKQFGVNTTLVDTHIGPSVTKFELRPENGVRVNRISNLQQDIKMGLAAKDIRIEAPIPGKSTVGIEIPNQEKTLVGMRDIMRTIPAQYDDKKLLFALGKDLMGQNIYGELNKMPHLLIAGATGSGKSVCVNSIICSILMRAKPDEVRMLLIDPKKVEFTQYANIPHLIAPVVTNGTQASNALKRIVSMMEGRYELFSKVGVRNISGYNSYLFAHPEEQLQAMPYIMVVIDELADLMLVAAKEVEASIQRITQLARAAGIHLIVATQRPSVDVITGVIKANIPSRIAFAVSSAIDSRTILDQQGAEKLLGLGDMLYIPVGEQSATRVQGCFVSDDEVSAIANYCSAQSLPKFEDEFLRLDGDEVSSTGGMESSSDPLYEEVKRFVIESGKASTSFIQRKFSIGYSRAARLIDMLEMEGIIGPSRGSKPREVFVQEYVEE